MHSERIRETARVGLTGGPGRVGYSGTTSSQNASHSPTVTLECGEPLARSWAARISTRAARLPASAVAEMPLVAVLPGSVPIHVNDHLPHGSAVDD